jgi:hypothetical protein
VSYKRPDKSKLTSFILSAVILLAIFIAYNSYLDTSESLVQGSSLPAWIKESRGSIKILSRNVSAYHWQSRSRILAVKAPNHTDYGSLQIYLRNNTAKFFSESIDSSGDMLGNGLYFSADPVATKSFGGDDWGLIATEFGEGTKFFDTTSFLAQQNYSAVAIKELQSFGCNIQQPAQLFSRDVACAKAARELVRTLNTYVVVYQYNGVNIPTCPDRPTLAYVVFDVSAFAPGKTRLYLGSNSRSQREEPELNFINEYYRQTSTGILWPNLISKIPRETFNNTVKARVMGCGDYEEDFGSAYQWAHKKIANMYRRGAKIGSGIDPLKFANLAARRFIANDLWEAAIQRGQTDPSKIYSRNPDDFLRLWQLSQAVRNLADRNKPLAEKTFINWLTYAFPDLQQKFGFAALGTLLSQADSYFEKAEVNTSVTPISYPNYPSTVNFNANKYLVALKNPLGFAAEMYSQVFTGLAAGRRKEIIARLIMDYISQRAGLGIILAPTFSDPKDLANDSKAAHSGFLKALKIMESCMERYENEDYINLQHSECRLLP